MRVQRQRTRRWSRRRSTRREMTRVMEDAAKEEDEEQKKQEKQDKEDDETDHEEKEDVRRKNEQGQLSEPQGREKGAQEDEAAGEECRTDEGAQR